MDILVLALALVQSASLSGRVVDASGGALKGATVSVICTDFRSTVATDATGRFHFDRVPAARCRMTASLDGFVSAEQLVEASASAAAIDFRLDVRPFAQQVAVTTRGTAEDASRVAQSASRVDRAALESRPFTIVTQSLKEEVGVLAQQTTSAQGSPVLRGFTGQRNLYLIDGVRFNTAAWRDGPSQYLAWLPAADVDHIEVVRGPASAQYGSDALGGTVGLFARSLSCR
ncbi:MAG: TonB-dependent receptor plug domain-containing protein [Acidimicrobiia bacterium]